jgi:hypothetical protein
MNYAVVNKDTSIVENVIVLEDVNAWTPPENMLVVPLDDVAGIGDTWDGTQFIYAPEPEVIDPTGSPTNPSPGNTPNVIG